MSMKRRDFMKVSGIAAVGSTALAAYPSQKSGPGEVTESEKGTHPILTNDHPYVFIDSCMQIWPDADFAQAHRHGVTAYTVTAWDPHIPARSGP